jgi:hypothetical protein
MPLFGAPLQRRRTVDQASQTITVLCPFHRSSGTFIAGFAGAAAFGTEILG